MCKEQLVEVLRELLRDGDRLISVSFPTPELMPWIKAFPPKDLVEIGKVHFPGVEFEASDSLEDSLKTLESISSTFNSLPVLCGSLYLLSEFYRKYIE